MGRAGRELGWGCWFDPLGETWTGTGRERRKGGRRGSGWRSKSMTGWGVRRVGRWGRRQLYNYPPPLPPQGRESQRGRVTRMARRRG